MKVFSNFLRFGSWILFICFWIYAIYCYKIFPETIPVHFNLAGNPDRYGTKLTLLLIAVIASFVFSLLTFISNKTNFKKFSKTNINSDAEYFQTQLLFFYLRFIIIVIFIISILSTHLIILNKISGLSAWFTPILLILVLLPVGFYVYRNLKSK